MNVTVVFCLKINFNSSLSNVPLIEVYEAEDWEPIMKSQILLGIIFKSYYKDKKGKDYVLNETRRLENGQCIIEYNLYKLGKQNELNEVDFTAIPELSGLKQTPRQVIALNHLFAIPMRYYYNPLYKNRGKSVFDGKLDLFDMMDEIWSQAGQTVRVSTPVEYYDVSILSRTKDGLPILPSKYNRQYVAVEGMEDGDGVKKGLGVITTQPELNFEKYSVLASDVLGNFRALWANY